MADFNSGLPIRSEADGADQRVQVKIVDYQNPGTQQATVDTDNNVHVEIHGNDPAGIDRVVRTTELGALNPDGFYDATDNTKPGTISIVASTRDASPGDTTQTQRLTSVTNGSKRLLDVSMHDENGDAYSQTNPLPVAISDSEGIEVADYQTTADLAKSATIDHDYVISGTDFKLQQIIASGSGKIKVEVLVGPDATLVAKATFFNSTANPNIDWTLKSPIQVAVGDQVTVRITNIEVGSNAFDVYSTVVGYHLLA